MFGNETLEEADGWCVVGITGIGCSGKTTLAGKLHSKIPGSQVIHQDDYFWPKDYEGHVLLPGLKNEVANWEITSSVNFDLLISDIRSILQSPSLTDKRVLILEGHLILNEPRIFAIADKKVCLTMSKEQCWERRQHRYYGSHDSHTYFNIYAWPEYQNRLREMAEMNSRANQGSAKIQFINYDTDFDKLSDELAIEIFRICERKAKILRKKL